MVLYVDSSVIQSVWKLLSILHISPWRRLSWALLLAAGGGGRLTPACCPSLVSEDRRLGILTGSDVIISGHLHTLAKGTRLILRVITGGLKPRWLLVISPCALGTELLWRGPHNQMSKLQ